MVLEECTLDDALYLEWVHAALAFFSLEGVFNLARYPAAFHKGTLASLSGIESGGYPVDVIFCMPGDPLLRR